MIEKDLLRRLLATDALTGFVGNRIAPHKIGQQEPLPYVTFFRAGTERAKRLLNRTRQVKATVQFDCWSADYFEAKLIAKAIVDALESPVNPGQTANAEAIFVEDEAEEFFQADDASDEGVYLTTLSLSVSYVE